MKIYFTFFVFSTRLIYYIANELSSYVRGDFARGKRKMTEG